MITGKGFEALMESNGKTNVWDFSDKRYYRPIPSGITEQMDEVTVERRRAQRESKEEKFRSRAAHGGSHTAEGANTFI